MKIKLVCSIALLACPMASHTMRASDEPVVWMPLIETQREIQATGHIEKGAKGYFFKALTDDKVYFEPVEDLSKLHAHKTMVRMLAFLVQNGDGDDEAESYCLMHLK